MTYGKLIDGQLITPDSIPLGRGQWNTNPTAEQYIDHGYKEVVDIQPTFANYNKSYTETTTQIIVNYIEVVVPEMAWHEDTNFQIKFRPMDLIELLAEHKGMIEYTDILKRYSDISENVYFYVNYFTDMEKELIERFAIVTPKNNINEEY